MEYKAFEEFCNLSKIEYRKGESMKLHTSFKIGGEADLFVTVRSTEELREVILKAKSLGIPYFILGKGSNLLVSDKGIEGIVISLSMLDGISVNDDRITAGAGATLAAVCNAALEHCLSGLEFAFGIPGTVGGAIYMNAGAYGGEMSQVAVCAEYITEDGEIKTVSIEDMELGYRTSIFKKGGMTVTSVSFKLKKGEKQEIKGKMCDFIERRKSKQPLEYPSAGSTFKRPEGYFAGALIEQNGLKGKSVGAAQVSEKHAGFVINTGNATCSEVLELIEEIRKTVKANDNVELETEVIFVGRK